LAVQTTANIGPVYMPNTINPRLGTEEHYRWLRGIIVSILVLNVCDAVFTMIWIETGVATEANPLLRELVNEYPLLFVLVKTTLVSLGCLLLWRFRNRATSIIGIFIAFLVYYLLLLYHLNSMELRLFTRFFN